MVRLQAIKIVAYASQTTANNSEPSSNRRKLQETAVNFLQGNEFKAAFKESVRFSVVYVIKLP